MPSGNDEIRTVARSGQLLKILCPRCQGPMTLDDFEITDHQDGTWTAEPSVDCPHDCGAKFFVTRSRVEWVKNS